MRREGFFREAMEGWTGRSQVLEMRKAAVIPSRRAAPKDRRPVGLSNRLAGRGVLEADLLAAGEADSAVVAGSVVVADAEGALAAVVRAVVPGWIPSGCGNCGSACRRRALPSATDVDVVSRWFAAWLI